MKYIWNQRKAELVPLDNLCNRLTGIYQYITQNPCNTQQYGSIP